MEGKSLTGGKEERRAGRRVLGERLTLEVCDHGTLSRILGLLQPHLFNDDNDVHTIST